MVGRTRRTVLGLAALTAAALAFGGCDWPMFGYDAGLTHSSADNNISAANVSTIKQLFVSSGAYSSPAEANGVLYAGGQSGDLSAFDANGVTNCSGAPNACSPLWTYTTTGGFDTSAPTVANGVLYALSSSGIVDAFDAGGVTDCSGTPKVCTPVWTAGTSGGESSVDVVNGVLYTGGSFIEAFSANGTTDCAGAPKVCRPLWTSTSNESFSSPAVSNGVLYASGTNDELYAFDAAGSAKCSGTPTTCSPLWTASMGTTTSTSSPAVSAGVVYDESNDAKLLAFDADGVVNCSGTPKTCNPLWSAALAGNVDNSSPAVAHGIVYAPSTTLQAFDASGSTDCTGTPKTCTPLWTDKVTVIGSSPSVANGLVYIGSASNGSPDVFGVEAFDANGHTGCSGTPSVCTPLWTGQSTGIMTGSPAVANGKVYDADNSFGLGFETHLYGWVLPAPTTSVIVPATGRTVSGTDQALDAGASPGVTKVQYELTGGTLHNSVIATAALTAYGWIASWNTTSVANGTYTLQSVASYGSETSGTSPGITIVVAN